MSGVMLITGGGRGIGAATARLAAEQGYAVCFSYLRDAEAAQKLAREIGAKAVQGDVASEADVLRLFEESDRLGPLKVLVNNAGIVDRSSRVEAMSAERIQRMLAINVTGSFLCAREAVKRMSTRHGGKGGAIVNVSSMAAKLGSPGDYVDYAGCLHRVNRHQRAVVGAAYERNERGFLASRYYAVMHWRALMAEPASF
jgi:NAD(P)-dependent dehydrogenase (short-subunit alcohol dehydrogenase family)